MRHFGSALRHSSKRTRSRAGERGFTLLETLAAIAIAVVTFSVVTELAGQMLRNWNRGAGTITAMEMLTRGLSRLEADLSLALPVRSPAGDGSTVLFSGDANQLTFVAATGFGAGDRGAELISISAVSEMNETALIRQRGPIAVPGVLRDPVVLMRGRMQVRFVFRDASGRTMPTWTNQPELPGAVEVQLLDAAGTSLFPVAAVMKLPVNFSIECLSQEGEDESRAKRCPNLRAAAEEAKRQDQAAEREANQQNSQPRNRRQ